MRRREFFMLLGGALARPSLAYAQQPGRVYRIAFVHPSYPVARLTETAGIPRYRAFFEEMRHLGYVEGQNLVIERYSAGGRTDRYGETVQEVVRSRPDLIFPIGARMTVLFKQAEARTTPVVAFTSDPIAYGITTSLARPGSNITGVVPESGMNTWDKVLQFVKEAVPAASKVAYLAPRAAWEGVQATTIRDAATRLGISLFGAPLESPINEPEFRRAFATMVQEGANAVIVADTAENYAFMQLIIELAEKSRLPTGCPNRDFVELGGLLAYAADYPALFRQVARYIDQVLKGAPAGEIPFYQATKFELVINRKTADALGLTLPTSLLALADEVIE
jgi:putative tryptophan/tyrosine transport system substrate-binding protein